jgi:hypothetical protein
MWKLIVGFIALAAIALYVLSQGGDIDLSGEKHGSAAPAGTVAAVSRLA